MVGFGNKDEEYGEEMYKNSVVDERRLECAERRKEIEENTATERNTYLNLWCPSGRGNGVIAAGTVDMLNRAAEALTGFSDEEAVGKPDKEVFRIAPSGKTRWLRPDESVLPHMKGRNGEIRFNLLIGRIYNIEDSAAPILDENNLYRCVVFRDVTEKRNNASASNT